MHVWLPRRSPLIPAAVLSSKERNTRTGNRRPLLSCWLKSVLRRKLKAVATVHRVTGLRAINFTMAEVSRTSRTASTGTLDFYRTAIKVDFTGRWAFSCLSVSLCWSACIIYQTPGKALFVRSFQGMKAFLQLDEAHCHVRYDTSPR